MYDVINTILILFLLFIISTWFIIFLLRVKDKLSEKNKIPSPIKDKKKENCPTCKKETPIIHIDLNNNHTDNKTKNDYDDYDKTKNDYDESDTFEVIIDDNPPPSNRETCARPIDEMVNETLMTQFYTGMFN